MHFLFFCFNYTGIYSPQANEIVNLDVGGHMYTTTRSTLTRFPSSLTLMCILQIFDSDGKVFIDRNGRMFEYILEFLRTNKLSLPDDFSDFASLTAEVEFYDIPELTLSLERVEESKLHVNYIEILETRKDKFKETVLKGKKEVLETLPLTAFKIEDKVEPKNAKASSYVEITFDYGNARLQLAEILSNNGWTCESSDFSSTSYQPPYYLTINEQRYRDRWRK